MQCCVYVCVRERTALSCIVLTLRPITMALSERGRRERGNVFQHTSVKTHMLYDARRSVRSPAGIDWLHSLRTAVPYNWSPPAQHSDTPRQTLGMQRITGRTTVFLMSLLLKELNSKFSIMLMITSNKLQPDEEKNVKGPYCPAIRKYV